jgi:hypothetical protein
MRLVERRYLGMWEAAYALNCNTLQSLEICPNLLRYDELSGVFRDFYVRHHLEI